MVHVHVGSYLLTIASLFHQYLWRIAVPIFTANCRYINPMLYMNRYFKNYNYQIIR